MRKTKTWQKELKMRKKIKGGRAADYGGVGTKLRDGSSTPCTDCRARANATARITREADLSRRGLMKRF